MEGWRPSARKPVAAGRMGWRRTARIKSCGELEHRLRNELFALKMRGDATREETVRHRAELKARLAGIAARLAENARRV